MMNNSNFMFLLLAAAVLAATLAIIRTVKIRRRMKLHERIEQSIALAPQVKEPPVR